MNAPRDVLLYGLRIRSALDWLDLPCVESEGIADVEIAARPLSPGLPSGEGVHAIDGGTLFNVDGVARFSISGGNRIDVERAPGAPWANVRLYLFGTALGILLQQRGLLPLHANAVVIDGRAAAFTGESGSGKSTLAAWFHGNGHAVLADDICVIDDEAEGKAAVRPGLPRVRLWKEAIRAFGKTESAYPLSFAGDPAWEKYDVPIDCERPRHPAPLVAIYLLDRGETFAIEALTGLDSAECLFANTYRGELIDGSKAARAHFSACLSLASHVPMFRLRRPWGLERLDEDGSRLVRHVRALAKPDGAT